MTETEIKTTFRVEGLETCKTGSVATYTLLAEDESGQPKDVEMTHLKAWLKGPVDIDGKCRRMLKGQYALDFHTQDPGHYYLDVQVDSQPIFVRDDIKLEVSNKSPRNRQKLGFLFEGDGFYSGRVAEPSEFRILTKDDADRNVDIDILVLEVRVKGPASHNEKIAVHKEAQGKYLAKYVVNVPGEYTISVIYDERPVANQKVYFSDVSRGEKSVISNIPTGNVRSREVVTVKIQSRDMFGNDVKTGGDQWAATSTGPAAAQITVVDQLDGTYLAELQFPRAGVYHVDFKLLGAAPAGSPIKFTAI